MFALALSFLCAVSFAPFASATDVSASTCEALEWVVKEDTPMLCGQSQFNRCYRNEKWTYDKAFEVCENKGGR